MKVYHDMLRHVLENGDLKSNRTGVDTLSVFGYQARFNMKDGFPLMTTKKMFTKGIIHELLWFLNGDTHVKYLQDNNVKIWDEWATAEQTARFGREEGDLGPIYGHQWRRFGQRHLKFEIEVTHESGKVTTELVEANLPGIDQIETLVKTLKENPDSRRMIVTGWNPLEADDVALPPCHTLWHCNVSKGKLNMQLYQRSADIFLGVPFNIASYSLLLHMLAQVCGLKPGEFIHTFGDLHLYTNHVDQAKLQLSREPLPLPTLELNPEVKNIFDFKFEDIKIKNYQCHPKIVASVAV